MGWRLFCKTTLSCRVEAVKDENVNLAQFHIPRDSDRFISSLICDVRAQRRISWTYWCIDQHKICVSAHHFSNSKGQRWKKENSSAHFPFSFVRGGFQMSGRVFLWREVDMTLCAKHEFSCPFLCDTGSWACQHRWWGIIIPSISVTDSCVHSQADQNQDSRSFPLSSHLSSNSFAGGYYIFLV